jgi:hypothetical protein
VARLETTESQIQSAYFDWVRIKELQDPRYSYLFKVPNETRGNYGWLRKLQKEGMAKGMLDVLCAWPMPPFSGLAIEFKRKGGKPSKEQEKWIAKLLAAKWCVVVCDSVEQGQLVTESYFDFCKDTRGTI